METKELLDAIKFIRDTSVKRNFEQSFDLIFTLKGLDIKKQDQQVDFFTNLHFPVRKRSVCGFVGPELLEQAKKALDEFVEIEEFPKYEKDKKLIKKLAEKHDFFVAQATIMPKVAQVFGRVIGPKAKMPNPKTGCVVPPNANLAQLYERLQTTLNIKAKSFMMIQAAVGREGMKDEEIAENIKALYEQLIHHLPQEKNNVKSVILKLTMGKPYRFGREEPAQEGGKKPVKEKKAEGGKKAEEEKQEEQPGQDEEKASASPRKESQENSGE